ncbi:MAG: hypothetical protein IKP76_02785 [Bacilli bacterium]|nr:hypothetical protein [Bacilli bacterium]
MDNVSEDVKKANEQIEKALNNMSSNTYNEEQSERLMEDFGGIPTGVGSKIDSDDERFKEADQQIQEVFETDDIDYSELNMENFGGIPTGAEKTSTMRK